MAYIGRSTDGFGVRDSFYYVVSAGATSVSGADADGRILKFSDGKYIDVYLNGILLKPTTDYTVGSNAISGISAMTANDEITVIVYDVFAVADTVSATNGGTFSGNIELTSTDDGATADPTLTLYRNSSSPAVSDFIGEILFKGRNNNSQDVNFGSITGQITGVNDGSEHGLLNFNVVSNGTQIIPISIKGNGNTVFNHRPVLIGNGSSLIFEGSTNDNYEITIGVTDPTADRTITLPDATGQVVLSSGAIDTSAFAEIGRTHIGYVGFNDYAGFSHIDQNSTTGYAFIQGASGAVYLNAPTGQSINVRNNNSDTMQLNTSGLLMRSNKTIMFEGATDDSKETTLTVADPTADRTITFPNATGTVITTGNTSEINTLSSITSLSASSTNTTLASFINSGGHNTSRGVVHVKQSNATNNPTMVIEQVGNGGNPSDTQGLYIKIGGQNQGSGHALRITTQNSNINSGTAFDPFLVTNGGTTRFNGGANGRGYIDFYNNALYLGSNTGEVYATDSGGNHTQLSPHNFQYIPDGASEVGAWAYLSEKVTPRKEIITKTIDGKEITEETGEIISTREKEDNFTYVNVDMMKVVREVEKLTGTKLVYTGNQDGDDGSTVKDDIIAGLIKRIEALESK